MRRFLIIGAGLIALYLVLNNYTGAGKDLSAGKDFLVGGVKAFQGR